MVCTQELERLARAAPDAAVVDARAPVCLQRLVPGRQRLGQDAAPAELGLEQVRIVQRDAVGGAEIDEEAVALLADLYMT